MLATLGWRVTMANIHCSRTLWSSTVVDLTRHADRASVEGPAWAALATSGIAIAAARPKGVISFFMFTP